MPVVTTLHTVLQNPDAGQKETLEDIGESESLENAHGDDEVGDTVQIRGVTTGVLEKR